MRRTLITLAGLAVAACGIPQETHDAVVKDLENCKSQLASTKGTLQTTEGERNKLKDQLDSSGADRDALAKKLGATKMEIDELRKARAMAEQRTKTFRQLLDRLKSMISSGKLQVEIRKGRMIVKMSDKILFDPGKDQIKKEGQQAMMEVTKILASLPDRVYQVAGHTDNIPIRSRRFKSNWELSTARAVNVVKFMAENGIDAKRLSAAGYSEYDPVGDNSTDEGRMLNRRIEITLMPSIEELPKFGE